MAKLPLAFIPAGDDLEKPTRFGVRAGRATVSFSPTDVEFKGSTAPPLQYVDTTATLPPQLTLRYLGANRSPILRGGKLLPGVVNFFLGGDPREWRTHIATYASIVYESLYDGIDLVYDGSNGQLKATYFVEPGADPGQIRWQFAGASHVAIASATGELNVCANSSVLHGVVGCDETGVVLTERRPIAWQTIRDRRTAVTARFTVGPAGEVGFVIGAYDRRKPLVIDPTLIFSTYLGGLGRYGDQAFDIQVDRWGQAVVVGATDAADFPVVNPAQGQYEAAYDIFVSKLNAAGDALVYSTYIGGNDNDYGYGVALDSTGRVHITGWTESTNFPTAQSLQSTLGGERDAIVLTLSSDGTRLESSTYLGGRRTDTGQAIAVADTGDVFVTGASNSPDFPTANALQSKLAGGDDAFVARIGPAGENRFSTFFGGGGDDTAYDLVLDDRSVYFAGETRSADFPIVAGLSGMRRGGSDAFVSRFAASGDRIELSTLLGGDADDGGRALALGPAGTIGIAGLTRSGNFPTQTAFQRSNRGSADAFVTLLQPVGPVLSFSTYLGGAGNDQAESLAFDGSGSAVVVGTTNSTDFPIADSMQPSLAGNVDGFASKLAAPGDSIVWSTFLGGDQNDGILGVTVDAADNSYLAGYTKSQSFPTRGPLQPAYGGGFFDAIVAKIGDPNALLPTPEPGPTTGALGGGLAFAQFDEVTEAFGFGPLSSAQRASHWDTMRSTLFGTSLRPVASSPSRDEIMPDWIPGCKAIAYSAGRQIAVPSVTPAPRRTRTPTPPPPPTSTATDEIAVRYRADMTPVANDATEADQTITVPFDIFTVDADGGNVLQITNTGWNEWHPDIAPNGRRIAFTADRFNDLDVFIGNSDGTGSPTRLTLSPQADSEPDWTPDGLRILYTCQYVSQTELCVMNADGSGEPTRLTNNTGRDDLQGAWSPDGSQIAYTVRSLAETGASDIWLMNADGTNAHAVVTGPGAELDPAWLSTNEIYFTSTGTPRSVEGPLTAAMSLADEDGWVWRLERLSGRLTRIIRGAQSALCLPKAPATPTRSTVPEPTPTPLPNCVGPTGQSLSGKVTVNGQPATDTTVFAGSESGYELVKTDARGEYRMGLPAPGKYRLRVYRDAIGIHWEDVEVVANTCNVRHIPLEIPGRTFEWPVEDNGLKIGRITSWFDHQYPVYKKEATPSSAALSTVILFDGLNHPDDSYSGHPALDIGGSGGKDVVAAASGRVVQSGWVDGGLGYSLTLRHVQGYMSVYGHMARASGLVEQDQVDSGDRIGEVGNTGCGDCGPHLHFEVSQGGKVVDPFGWDPPAGDPWVVDRQGPVSRYLFTNETLRPSPSPGVSAIPSRTPSPTPGASPTSSNSTARDALAQSAADKPIIASPVFRDERIVLPTVASLITATDGSVLLTIPRGALGVRPAQVSVFRTFVDPLGGTDAITQAHRIALSRVPVAVALVSAVSALDETPIPSPFTSALELELWSDFDETTYDAQSVQVEHRDVAGNYMVVGSAVVERMAGMVRVVAPVNELGWYRITAVVVPTHAFSRTLYLPAAGRMTTP